MCLQCYLDVCIVSWKTQFTQSSKQNYPLKNIYAKWIKPNFFPWPQTLYDTCWRGYLPSWPSYCSLCRTCAAVSPSSWRGDEASARSSEMLVVCQPSCSCLVANVQNMSFKATCLLLVCKRHGHLNQHPLQRHTLMGWVSPCGYIYGLWSTYTSHAQYASHKSSHIHSSGFSQGSPQI